MSPVEPRPLVIGTMGLPSTEGATGLCFLPKMAAALLSCEAKSPPVREASRARNERRVQSNLGFISDVLCRGKGYFSGAVATGLTTRALPTISIKESPGIHSTAMHARDGILPGEK